MRKGIKTILILALIIVVFILIAIRLILPMQLDDVNPSRLCDERLLNKSSVLMVIPLLGNQSIAENPGWCEHIKSLNKTIGMHGVYHTEKEFRYANNEEDIRRGMEEFNQCFGFYPTIFKAPQLSLSKKNEEILREMNFTIIKLQNQIIHKTYHCTDYEKKSWLVKLNYLNDFI